MTNTARDDVPTVNAIKAMTDRDQLVAVIADLRGRVGAIHASIEEYNEAAEHGLAPREPWMDADWRMRAGRAKRLMEHRLAAARAQVTALQAKATAAKASASPELSMDAATLLATVNRLRLVLGDLLGLYQAVGGLLADSGDDDQLAWDQTEAAHSRVTERLAGQR